MIVEHRAAFASLLYGLVAMILFLAPLYMYYGEYNEKEEKKGRVGSGDIVGMVGQTIGLHLGLLFLFTVALLLLKFIFQHVESMNPTNGLENFFLINEGDGSDFVSGWMTRDWSVSPGGSPLGEAASVGFGLTMSLLGVLMTLVYIGIPAAIVLLSIQTGMSAQTQNGQESAIYKIMSAAGFFVGATVLVWIHSVIASSLVIVLTGETDFFFFDSITDIWHKLFFGLGGTA